MSQTHGPGKSDEATLLKETWFGFCVNDSVVHAPTHLPYCVADINAGPGANEVRQGKIKGTPRIALKALQGRARSGILFACDKDGPTLAKLQAHIPITKDLFGGGVDVRYVLGDNAEFVPTITTRLRGDGLDPRHVPGILVADPNGLEVPVRHIRDLVAEMPAFDVFIHISGLMGQRIVHGLQAGKDGECRRRTTNFQPGPGVVMALAKIWAIRRRCWLIGEIKNNRGHVVLFGSNRWLREIRHPRVLPMVRVDSSPGQEIARRYGG